MGQQKNIMCKYPLYSKYTVCYDYSKLRVTVNKGDIDMRAATYLRVSTEDQALNGYGLDVQDKRTRAMITVKGWDVAEPPFSDEGLSGTLGVAERPGLAALMEAAYAKRIDAVVVGSLDRIGRKTNLVLDVIDKLSKAGVVIISCNESIDTSTPSGQFALTMFAALAQLERDTIVVRTTAGRNERGSKDGERGGRVPFGYHRVLDDRGKASGIVVDGTAAAIVERIFEAKVAGQSLTAIADMLNAEGITTARGHGWHASSVRQVLLNEDTYKGGTRGDSDKVWPALLQ